MEYLLLGRSRSGVGVDIFRSESESESLKIVDSAAQEWGIYKLVDQKCIEVGGAMPLYWILTYMQ